MMIFILLWFAIGCGSFVYWWTSDHDFTVSCIPVMLFMGLIGPISFFVGWGIHGNDKTVLIPKRKKRDQ